MSTDLQNIVNLLSESKADKIHTFKMPEYICENIVIATSLNAVHSYSLAEKIREYTKERAYTIIVDGDSKDGWVVVEIPEVQTMVHLMFQEKRDFYNIEEILELHNNKAPSIKSKKEQKAK